MSLSTPFIHRPVATTLLTIAVALAGVLGYISLPVSPLPQVEFPTIQVSGNLPGASPAVMASAVATPLERQFGRIAGITEMTSTSALGTASITIQFDLSRNIDAAGRDVQAAINAAAGQLPSNLPGLPTYRKVNPADAPILLLAITSTIYSKGQLYDVASSIVQQKLSQVPGVGQVMVGGGALPAVRVEVNPTRLHANGLNFENVRSVLAASNANTPKGTIDSETRSVNLATTDQLLHAKDYSPLIVAYKNGAPVRMSDIGNVVDSVEDLRTLGLYNTEPAIVLIIFRQPGANIIDAVDRVKRELPRLQAAMPRAMDIKVVMDRAGPVKSSVHDVELTLLISIGLVILVVFLFLRNIRATLIPSVAVPVSLIGTFGVMYLVGYSIDNLSLMALTIATGFVVDDAIVVIENITRHLEAGMQPLEAALLGAREIGFTVVSISVSLVAVFIPILLMSGIVGRLFREFAVTLSVAIGVSMVVSLTTTPMMCAKLLRAHDQESHGGLYRFSEGVFNSILRIYELSLRWVLRHPALMLLTTLITMGLTVVLLATIPKGFFPQQDTGQLTGSILADQDTSFHAMAPLITQFASAVSKDPDVENSIAFTGGGGGGGGGGVNSGRMFVTLKPIGQRKSTADEVRDRLRKATAKVAGGSLLLQSVQDLRIGGRPTATQYQYTVQADEIADLNHWAPILVREFAKLPGMVDVISDQQNSGLESRIVVDRDTAARLGISQSTIDNTLYDAFGQRQVSTMYEALNQYHVVMEADPQFTQDPAALREIYLKARNGSQIPLSTFCHFGIDNAPLQVNHTGQFPSITISFNLTPGVSLNTAFSEIEQCERKLGMPTTIHGNFAGTAAASQDLASSEVYLIIAAVVAIYLVLGILYESLVHPITILSTIPSAGVGAFVALILMHMEFNVIGLIGVLLLIGIVKKNAIMMIDFALETERSRGLPPTEAIFQACLLRFRPILMTTLAALFGGLPLAIGVGSGAELRQPLGVTIVGGLIFSQLLTLYTTPVVYLYLDRLRLAYHRIRGHFSETPGVTPVTS